MYVSGPVLFGLSNGSKNNQIPSLSAHKLPHSPRFLDKKFGDQPAMEVEAVTEGIVEIQREGLVSSVYMYFCKLQKCMYV